MKQITKQSKEAEADIVETPITQLQAYLNSIFPERKEVIEGVLVTLLAGENGLLIGPPGTAKSALIRVLCGAVENAHYFERLLTKFSTPEELFGPISLSALKQDRFERNVAGKLPEAEIAFVDEVFKANSAILNSMLTVMNERKFHNDGKILKVPLISLWGASNELPEGKELDALFDRFMMRFEVKPLITAANMKKMILAPEPTAQTFLSAFSLREEMAKASKVEVSPETIDALVDLREVLAAQHSIFISDRRLKKSVGLLKAVAHLGGAQETSPEDLDVLKNCFWREPAEINKIAKEIGKFSDPVQIKVMEILAAAREEYKRVEGLKGKTVEFKQHAVTAVDRFADKESELNRLYEKAGKRTKHVLVEAREDIRKMAREFSQILQQGLNLSAKK